MSRLVVVSPQGHIRYVELASQPETESESLSLGRATNNHLAFPEDNGLSRHHLRFEHLEGKWSVRDLESKNGTRVNGDLVVDVQELQPGDRVSAGRVTMTYQETGAGEHIVSFEPSEPASAETTFLGEVLAEQRSGGRDHSLPFSIFVRAGRELTKRRPLPELFGVILDLCLEAVPAQRGVLLTLDEGGGLTIQASRGEEMRISRSVRDRVLSEKCSVLVRDAQQDELVRQSDTIHRVGVCSLLAVPLQSDDSIMGLVYLDSLDRKRRFSSEEMSILTALANVAGIRIELEQWEYRNRQLISDNVTNLSRLTAGLSHELNSPLGTLKSSLDSLFRLALRRENQRESKKSNLEAVLTDLRSTLDASLSRMQQVISRIQRFANLDRAETRSVDLKELLQDVVDLLEHESNRVEVEFLAVDLPHLTCHPQPLSAAVSSLLSFAMETYRVDSDDTETVRLSAKVTESNVEIRIDYSNGALTPERLSRVFEPSFGMKKKRIASTNWSLFTAQQMIREQGGDVSAFAESGPRRGFLVTLPLPARA